MKLLIKIPTRSRATEFLKLYKTYKALCTHPDTFFSITIDDDDYEINKEIYDQVPEIVKGFSRSKIHAINRDIPIGWDVILLAADDMFPLLHGFDQAIIDRMTEAFPDTDGALWFNDGHTTDRLNTLPIIGRKYYDRFGYIYHPYYYSLFCDNEFTDVAKKLNKIKYFPEIIIRHEHPDWGGKVPSDALYERNNKFWAADQRTYNVRKLKGFPKI